MNGGPKENANPVIHAVSKQALPVEEEARSKVVFGRAVEAALRHCETTSFLQSLLHPEQNPTTLFPIEFAPSPSSKPSSSKITSPKVPSDPPNDDGKDPVQAAEIFELIRGIQDPEHPLTLEQLGVVSCSQIAVVANETNQNNSDSMTTNTTQVRVRFTPTIPHCSMATLIGLTLTVQLSRSLPRTQFRIRVEIEPGTHQSEVSINEQLADKERVCAALENQHLLGIVNTCIAAKDVEKITT